MRKTVWGEWETPHTDKPYLTYLTYLTCLVSLPLWPTSFT
jgi:hypothetical protein